MNKLTAYGINAAVSLGVSLTLRKVGFPKSQFQGRWVARQIRLAAAGIAIQNVVAPTLMQFVNEDERAEFAVLSGSPVAVLIATK